MKTMNKIFLIITSTALALTVRADREDGVPTQHNEATVAQLQAEMASGELTSEDLTKEYIARILALDQNSEGVNSVIELNPDALAMAKRADKLRKQGTVLGPLHGIPVLLKDNIDTGDKMQTTAGSFALFGRPAKQDSTVAAKLLPTFVSMRLPAALTAQNTELNRNPNSAPMNSSFTISSGHKTWAAL